MMTRAEINLLAERVAEILADRLSERTAEILRQKSDEMMSTRQCAQWMGISVHALRKRCEKGTVPFHKTNSRLYFYRNEVSEYNKNEKNRVVTTADVQ